MPCYDSRNEPDYVRSEALKEFNHNSPVAELLCWALTNMSQPYRQGFLRNNPKLGHWWRDHQERDKKKAAEKKAREEREQKRIREQIKELKAKLK